jgi:amino-acid N-acetyltransferase
VENWTSALGSLAARAAPGPTAVTLRTAQSSDVGALLELINGYAERGLLLWRSETSLRARLADFVVAVQETADGEEAVGCGALERLGPGLGEVRSLAVRPDAAGRGVGHGIVRRLLQGARGLGLVEVLALTRRASFFEALSFVATRRERFTDKLETDCRHCPRNHCCDEVAMVAVSPYRIAPAARAARTPTIITPATGASQGLRVVAGEGD